MRARAHTHTHMLLTSLPWGCCLVNDGRAYVEHHGWRLLGPCRSRSPSCPAHPPTPRNAALSHNGVMRKALTLPTRLPAFTHRLSDDERVSLHPPRSLWLRVKGVQGEHVSGNQLSYTSTQEQCSASTRTLMLLRLYADAVCVLSDYVEL